MRKLDPSKNYGLTHADLNLFNCLVDKGELKVIDFGDTRVGSYFYDFAVPLSYLDELEHYQALYDALCEGYTQVRPLSSADLKTVDTFMVARALDMIEWVHYDWPTVDHHPWGREFMGKYVRNLEAYI